MSIISGSHKRMRDVAIRTPIDILLVDDNQEDMYVLRRVFERSRLRKTLHMVESGEAALRFLRREPPYELAPRPKLIVLDLCLPGISGLDVLKVLKNDQTLRSIPAIILTGSTDDEDMLAAYDERARAVITKPGDLQAFEEVVERIEAFWLKTAQLPAD